MSQETETKKTVMSTKELRRSLALEDQGTWKRFTERRRQLLSTFSLGEQRASSQNDDIVRVADVLRTEFHYPLTARALFEKLVIAAVQSIRRNKKRAVHRQEVRAASKGSVDGVDRPSKIVKHKVAKPKVIAALPEPINPIRPLPSLPGFSHIDTTSHTTELHVSANQSIENLSSPHSPTPTHPTRTTWEQPSQLLRNVREPDLVRRVLSDIVNTVVPLHEQRRGSWHTEPDLSGFLTGNHRDMESMLPMETKQEIPFSLKEKLLQNIERSKTCSEVVNSPRTIGEFSVLASLGKSSYNTALTFVIEKFTAAQQNSLDILSDEAASMAFASDVCTSLFRSASKVDVKTALGEESRCALLFIAVGSLIKDFGFDSVLYPLCELVMQLIMIKHPIRERSNNMSTSSNQAAKNSSDALLLTLPINPQLANKELYRNVVIKYGSKEQNFKFPLLSNGPPTLSEIMKNSRALFAISDLNKIPLGLYHENSIITTDEHLASLFKGVSSKSLDLVIKSI